MHQDSELKDLHGWSPGARASTASPPARPPTTSRAPGSPSGVVSIPNGPSELAVKEAAWGLARYAAISQDNGLVPIVEPEILLDGEHGIERTFEVAQKVWDETFFAIAENNTMFEGIMLKPSMVTPGAEAKDRATPEQVTEYTLKLLHRRIPPAVPGIMFLSGGQSEVEATQNLNAMNQGTNPWHVSFSYTRALQNTCLKTWGGQRDSRGLPPAGEQGRRSGGDGVADVGFSCGLA